MLGQRQLESMSDLSVLVGSKMLEQCLRMAGPMMVDQYPSSAYQCDSEADEPFSLHYGISSVLLEQRADSVAEDRGQQHVDGPLASTGGELELPGKAASVVQHTADDASSAAGAECRDEAHLGRHQAEVDGQHRASSQDQAPISLPLDDDTEFEQLDAQGIP